MVVVGVLAKNEGVRGRETKPGLAPPQYLQQLSSSVMILPHPGHSKVFTEITSHQLRQLFRLRILCQTLIVFDLI